MDDDEGLWRAARNGDARAYERVYDRHRDRVFGQAARLLRSRIEAEDVTALVFLEAWRRRADVRIVDGSVLPWLLVTTNNVVRNVARAARRHRAAMERIASLAPVRADAEEAFEDVDSGPERSAVRRALAALRPSDREVLVLCVVGELPMQAAAAAMGVPVGTVKSRLSRAKRRLADRLGGSPAGPDPLHDLTSKEGAR
ncbi:RNA polymerase sigma factor [Curtobacterium pusillum]|uniref:RNA polymerase sigma factor n=1 Tax=Curtobacterium pusillum TaxID=69373 RepID=UPI0021B59CED|nr:sigma-70 family RNA polymerase sigma factor [Curtobacterium pusillum]